jgi:6-phosphogluconolactonase
VTDEPRAAVPGASNGTPEGVRPIPLADTWRAPTGDTVVVCRTDEDLARRASGYLASLLSSAAATRVGTIALAGGTTPAMTYRQLATHPLPWDRIVFFLGDERLVRPDHELSNYRMIWDCFAGASPRVLPMVPPSAQERGVPTQVLAADYAGHLESLVPRRDGEVPALDVAVLGLGVDGHIASLFPGAPALGERRAWVVEVAGVAAGGTGHPAVPRLTLTLPVLDAASKLVFLVSGEAKSFALREALTRQDPTQPVSLLRSRADRALWFADRAALGDLLPSAQPATRGD